MSRSAHSSAQWQREQLHRAAADGDCERVRDLIHRGYPLNRFDDTPLRWTPLHHAVRENRIEVVRLLLAAGADPNAHDDQVAGNTPLSENMEECTYEMAAALVKAGANPTVRGWMQMNAIDRVRERKDAERFLRLFGVPTR